MAMQGKLEPDLRYKTILLQMKRSLPSAHLVREAALTVPHGTRRERRRRRLFEPNARASGIWKNSEFEILVHAHEINSANRNVAALNADTLRVANATFPIAHGALHAPENHTVLQFAFKPHIRVQILRRLIANYNVNERPHRGAARAAPLVARSFSHTRQVLPNSPERVRAVHVDHCDARQVENADEDIGTVQALGRQGGLAVERLHCN
jgi:hypothetical protein